MRLRGCFSKIYSRRRFKNTFLVFFGICCVIGIGVHIPLSKALFSISAGTSLKITDRYGIILRETLSGEGGRTTWLAYEDIPETMIKALIDTEDKRFFSHSGVDLLALGRALFQNLRAGRVMSGASTITQQLVKNRFGYPRTLLGKLKEMVIALRLEQTFSKQEILAQYLNRVSFSNQTFGIESAAGLYFAKPAQHLSLAESVFLAGIIQAPSRFNPYRHFQRALQRQRSLLERLYRRGTINETAYRIALQEKIRLTPKKVNFKAPHFTEMVLDNLPENRVLTEISVVKTTLDYYLQEQVEEIVTTRIEELEDYHVTNAAVIVMNNHNGDILAFVGSKDFFDDKISGQVNGALSLRQPGSTLKPFTYQLALERSYTPATLIPDIQDFPLTARSFLPENYDRKFHGPVRLRGALACSYNIPAVRVLQEIGVEALYNRLQEFGFESLRELPSFYGPGLTLGNGEVTLLELTRAYSILARQGKRITERYILETLPGRRQQAAGSRQQAPQLFSPRVVYLLTHILVDRQATIPAFGENTPLELPFQTAVKTGTSKDYRDNWTVGFTHDYTVGVWVGNFDASPMRKVSGISGAAPIYRDVMLALYRYHNPVNLLDSAPAGIVSARICPISGDLVNEDCPHSIQEIFLDATEPTEPCRMHKVYWVDSRDGLLTDPVSPYGVKKVFIHFPPLYQTWAQEMGYPLPPAGYSSYAPSSSQDNASLSTGLRTDSSTRGITSPQSIRIVHPNDGDVYAIDPVLRREFQTMQLSVVAASGVSQVTWYVNGEQWETVETPFQSAWPITPGTHRLYVEGQHNGETLRSHEITVYVVK